jgi:hypothetical protein
MTSLLQSIPSPTKIREELEQMVLRDLLGPVGGPEAEARKRLPRSLRGSGLHGDGNCWIHHLASGIVGFGRNWARV